MISLQPIDYSDFLRAKVAAFGEAGIAIQNESLHPILKGHQRESVAWCLRKGRAALFASFGLGKTLMQLEIGRQLLLAGEVERALIVLPLGVRQEFVRDARLLGVEVTFVRTSAEVGGSGIYLTNYESVREGKLDVALFGSVSLDEAAILRGFGGSKTFRELMRQFEGTRFGFVATATPSPNEYIELLAYSAFLGVMDIGQSKTRWFKRNSTNADKLTLHPHKEQEFWYWVSTWSIFLTRPSDLCGCSCHKEKNSSVVNSECSRRSSGAAQNSGMEHGSASATVEGKSSPLPIDCSAAESSVVGVSAPGMEERGPELIPPGDAWSLASQPIAITPTEAYPSANDGRALSSSFKISDNLHPAQRSTGSTTTEATSPAIADGRPGSAKLEIPEGTCSSRSMDASKHLPDGQKNSASNTGRYTPGIKLAGQSCGCSTDRCLKCESLDEGYDLPALDVRWHELPSDHSQAGADRDGQNRMFRNAAIGVVDSAAEKRSSLGARVAKMLELRAEEPDEHRLIWHDLEDERRAIEAAIPDITTVYGSQSLEDREAAIIGFSDGEMAEMAGKPSIAGVGCNFQRHCARAIFLGIGHKFHDFIQSIHRIARFGQTRQVRIDLIYTEAEREIRRALEAKWQRHTDQTERMREIVQQYGLAGGNTPEALARAMGVTRQEVSGAGWKLVNNDSVLETAAMPDASVGLIVTSIPFSTQYEYTPNYADLGHSDDNDHFWAQMDYLTPSLLRVLQPGRDMVVHVKDRITPGGVNGLGFQTLHPFSDEAIEHYKRHGFAFLGRKTVTTDVVRENNQTYRLGWSEQCKDGSRMGCGVPEYLLLFRRPPSDLSVGYADVPIVKDKPMCADHGEPAAFDKRTNWRRPVPGTGYSRGRWQFDAHGYSRSDGNRLLTRDELANMPHEALYKWWREYSTDRVYDFREHLAVAETLDEMERLPATFMLLPPHSPHPDVLTDVARMRTLNMVQAQKGREAHVCPLQLDLVERCILQLSMPGEVVFDPFAGIGTVPYLALKHGRQGLGCELGAEYWRDAIHYCRAEEERQAIPSLFDLLDAADVAVAAAIPGPVEQISEAAD